jgi:murein DD-endopeptidase MepM/ murein hydrolase activator NlpD
VRLSVVSVAVAGVASLLLAVTAAGNTIPTGVPPLVTPFLGSADRVLPVLGAAPPADTFGALRSDVPGDWHHGDDIFAPAGTPVLAAADGLVFSVGWNTLGGWRLWLRDRRGNEYYYAHLSGYSSFGVDGAVVHAGDVLGFVGESGDAEGTPPHLHFEIHPVGLLDIGYDSAVDPTGYLRRWRRVRAVPRAAAGGWATDATGQVTGAVLVRARDISGTSGLVPGSLVKLAGGTR